MRVVARGGVASEAVAAVRRVCADMAAAGVAGRLVLLLALALGCRVSILLGHLCGRRFWNLGLYSRSTFHGEAELVGRVGFHFGVSWVVFYLRYGPPRSTVCVQAELGGACGFQFPPQGGTIWAG